MGRRGAVLNVLNLTRYRIFSDNATGLLAYPLSMTRRFEANLGFTRYSYDIEQDQILYDAFGQQIGQKRVQLDDQEPDPLNLFQASLAYVGDNSYRPSPPPSGVGVSGLASRRPSER